MGFGSYFRRVTVDKTLTLDRLQAYADEHGGNIKGRVDSKNNLVIYASKPGAGRDPLRSQAKQRGGHQALKVALENSYGKQIAAAVLKQMGIKPDEVNRYLESHTIRDAGRRAEEMASRAAAAAPQGQPLSIPPLKAPQFRQDSTDAWLASRPQQTAGMPEDDEDDDIYDPARSQTLGYNPAEEGIDADEEVIGGDELETRQGDAVTQTLREPVIDDDDDDDLWNAAPDDRQPMILASQVSGDEIKQTLLKLADKAESHQAGLHEHLQGAARRGRSRINEGFGERLLAERSIEALLESARATIGNDGPGLPGIDAPAARQIVLQAFAADPRNIGQLSIDGRARLAIDALVSHDRKAAAEQD